MLAPCLTRKRKRLMLASGARNVRVGALVGHQSSSSTQRQPTIGLARQMTPPSNVDCVIGDDATSKWRSELSGLPRFVTNLACSGGNALRK